MGCCQSNNSTSRTTIGLDPYTYDNTEPYYPNFTEGKVVKVYDGDTLHIVAKVEGKPYRFMIRMYGYDSPELKGKTHAAGLRAKLALESRIMNKVVRVEIHKTKEKYGRLLATIYDEGGNINTWMVDNDNGYGVPYFGGTKDT